MRQELLALFALCSLNCFHLAGCELNQLDPPKDGVHIEIELDPSATGEGGTELSNESTAPPRILTLLTTYGARASFAKANREAMEEREDGYRSLMFIASDAESGDEDGAIDYTFGLAVHHRLLGAVTEAYARHKGEFDWMAVGDDDTVFLYNRASALLSHIDHTQPVAIGRVDGLIKPDGYPDRDATCVTPSEKEDTEPGSLPDKDCCQDFTHSCNVPPFPNISNTVGDDWAQADPGGDFVAFYEKGGLFWPYGGSGTFLSAGLVEMVQEEDGAGWERCTEIFSRWYPTDIQLGACLRLHALTTSTYPEGFDRTCRTSDPTEIGDRLAANCQVLGIHLGIKHLNDGGVYTPEAFKEAASAVHQEDQAWTSSSDVYMVENCRGGWEAISKWK